ncbi:hypothetical protein MYU51_011839 [Penicillium brevicompactum]
MTKQDETSLPGDAGVEAGTEAIDYDDPQNWSKSRTILSVVIFSFLASVSPLASTITAPALPVIGKDLAISSRPVLQFTLSIYALGYAFGPLVLAPMSEVYGRVWVAQLSGLWFLVFNLACAFVHSGGALLALRFLAGLDSSTTLSVGSGVLADCYRPKNMGSAVAIYSLMPVVSPIMGPIIGGFVSQNTSWRWIFVAVSAWDAIIQIVALFFLNETYAPVIRARKLHGTWFAKPAIEGSQFRENLRRAGRSVRLLATKPLIQVLALHLGFLNGVSYIMSSTFPLVWSEVYHWSVEMGSLNYIALGLGAILGAQVCTRVNDRVYAMLSARNNGVGSPDYRLPTMLAGTLIAPCGLLWYGWSAEEKVHWIMPDIGGPIYNAGFMTAYINVRIYVIEFYGASTAASAVAAVSLLQYLFGGLFPLFGSDILHSIGFGRTNSVLAGVSLGLGLLALGTLWKFGPRLREKSKENEKQPTSSSS